MTAKERQCAVSRAQDALEVLVAAFEAVKDVPEDDENHHQGNAHVNLLNLKQNLHDWYELLAKKLA